MRRRGLVIAAPCTLQCGKFLAAAGVARRWNIASLTIPSERYLGTRLALEQHAHLHEPAVPVVRVPRPALRHLPDEGQVGPIRGRARVAVGENEVVRGVGAADAEVAPRRLHLPHREVEVRIAQACTCE